jgi:hypothetical protein
MQLDGKKWVRVNPDFDAPREQCSHGSDVALRAIFNIQQPRDPTCCAYKVQGSGSTEAPRDMDLLLFNSLTLTTIPSKCST